MLVEPLDDVILRISLLIMLILSCIEVPNVLNIALSHLLFFRYMKNQFGLVMGHARIHPAKVKCPVRVHQQEVRVQ